MSLLLLVVLVACAPGAAEPTVTTHVASTTTTIPNDTCDDVTDDAIGYLETVIDVLDRTRLRDFVDPERWSEELIDLKQAGKDLDLRVRALRCDAGTVQATALAGAELAPEGALGARLVGLLTAPSTAPNG